MKRLSSLFVLLYLAVGGSVQAKVVYVDKNASGPSHDGASWATAFITVQAAVDAAAPGDEVWVAASTPAAPAYAENVNIGKDVALYGGFAGGEIQRSQRDWKARPTVLDGGSNANGPSVACRSGTVNLDGFTIRNGTERVGVFSGGATISNNIVVGKGGVGVEVRSDDAAIVANNIIYGNVMGVGVWSGTVTLINNVIYSNSNTGVDVSAAAMLVNNTISSNGQGVSNDGIVELYSNIIAFNVGYGLRQNPYSPKGTFSVFSHNDVYGNKSGDYDRYTSPSGEGNLSADPKFATEYQNFHIQPDSACRDAGDDSAVTSGATDMDDQPRIQDAHVDIGADESDGTVWNIQPRILHVSPTGDDSNNGLNWQTAKKTVSGALAVAQGPDEVWVAFGTYVENIEVQAGVSLYGGFAGTETQRGQRDWNANPTVLDGNGGGVVTCRFRDVVVDGFTIRNGMQSLNIYNSVATIAHNVIRDGYVDVGNSTATLSNNTISGSYREGIRVQGGRVVFSNNTISGNAGDGVSNLFSADVTLLNNTISGNGGSGVAVGAGTSNDTPSTATLINNIIAFNSVYGVSRSSISSIPSFSHNDLFGNTKGPSAGFAPPSDQGNLALDPKLSNIYRDVHIQPDSACRDAGDDSAVTSGATDMDDQPRIQDAHVDIGADESDGTTWTSPSSTWYVSPSGDDANDGRTWGTAKRTVKGSLLVAQAGDEVWAAAGTYPENVAPGVAVAMYGGFAGTETQRGQRDWRVHPTVLNGTGGIVVACQFKDIVLDGFSIRTHGGNLGVNVGPGTAIISHNDISTNTGGSGIEVSGLGTTATITQNIIWNDATITYPGGEGISLGSGATATITNNTISGQSNLAVSVDGSTARIANNIIAFNGGNGIFKNLGSILAFSHNDVYGNGTNYAGYTPPSGQGNISVDPLFVDRAALDFHLQAGSPCVDAGDDSFVAAGDKDLDGRPRILGAHVDIGAYEYGVYAFPFTLADVKTCLSIACGLASGTPDDLARLNVYSGNSALDMNDAIRLARKVAGLEANP